ncbi:hypothetical protein SEA_CHOCOLAT_103 [Arthrobacter phage Chocolat]|uniref:Uncharacterized protein n=1 Tax=Arthrobacter phage Chocolat TaxID=1897526 RepID=A0A1I9SD39_9CAUD|nr:hypothetical protein SEA_CHOCOLAT_103 [Arthrobacter phage Chocolat]
MTAEQPLDLHTFAKGDTFYYGTSEVIYTATKVTKRYMHALGPTGRAVRFDLRHDPLTPAVATADEWPTVADLVECMQNEFRTEQGEDYTPSVDAVAESADELFPEVPDDDADAAAFHKRAEGIMNAALAIMRVWAAEQTPDAPTLLLHPKREVFNVSATLDGKAVVETITVQGNIKRARSVADMLACKYGFGPLTINFHTALLEFHQGSGEAGVEIEDMDADDPWEWGPHDEEMTAEMAAE